MSFTLNKQQKELFLKLHKEYAEAADAANSALLIYEEACKKFDAATDGLVEFCDDLTKGWWKEWNAGDEAWRLSDEGAKAADFIGQWDEFYAERDDWRLEPDGHEGMPDTAELPPGVEA